MEQFLQQTAQIGKYILLGITITAVILGITFFLVWGWIGTIARSAGTTTSYLYSEFKTGLTATPIHTELRKTILILGTDAVANRAGEPILTDTIMVASINLKTGAISLVSFPRDLWSEKYLTKINALYAYGDKFYPGEPEKLTAEVITELLDKPIHHTFVVSLDMLAELIDIVGGVEITVEESFTDTQFPRSDVPIDSTDPTLLYETVTFEQGPELMTSTRALKYIRSRKSTTEDQGTDLARSQRQQQVITALFNKIISPSVITDSDKVAALLLFYQINFSEKIALSELVATARFVLTGVATNNASIELDSHTLSVYPDTATGVIEHPNPKLYQNNWVYIVRDQNAFREEIRSYLK